MTLLERHSRVGIDAHRVDIDQKGVPTSIDVPSRMFNAGQWPNLIRLYDEIGVSYVPVDASHSYSLVPSSRGRSRNTSPTPSCYMRQNFASKARLSPGELLSPRARRIAREMLRFRESGEIDFHSRANQLRHMSFAEYLRWRSFGDEFVYRFLYPLLSSTVCSCRYENLDRYPAHVILETLLNLVRSTKLLRSKHGTSDVMSKLSEAPFDVATSAQVASVRRVDDGVVLNFDNDEPAQRFDHVVFATQANHCLEILVDARPNERDVLGAIRYDEVPVVIHQDSSLMPRQKSSWSTFNMLTDEEHSSASCTVWLNRFYDDREFPNPIFQTIGWQRAPAESKVIQRTLLQRGVVNHETNLAIESLARLHGEPDRNVWFCGSWASQGLPLLESAVVSSNIVAEQVAGRTQRLRRAQYG